MTRNLLVDGEKLMDAFGQTWDYENWTQAELYFKLILEELCETLSAVNAPAKDTIRDLTNVLVRCVNVNQYSDMVGIFDGLLDILVVTINAGFSLDMPMQEGWDEVFNTNMAKVDPLTGKVTRRADGKVLKPDGWVAPDLAAILTRHRNDRTLGKLPHEVGQIVEYTAAEDQPTVAGLSISDRYLNLALEHIGSCLVTMGRFRNQRKPAGADYAEIGIGLSRAIRALEGKPWEAPVGNNERDALAALETLVEEVKAMPSRDIDIPLSDILPASAHTHQVAFNRGYNVALAEAHDILIKGRKGAGS